MLCTEESGRTGQMDRQSACLACVTLELALRSAFEQLASHLSDFGRGGWRGSQYSVNIKKKYCVNMCLQNCSFNLFPDNNG